MPSIGTMEQIKEILDMAGGFQVRIGKAPNELAKMINRKKICVYCNKHHETKLMTCGSCEITRYCDAECQKADWKNHKKYCGSQTKCSYTPTLDIFMRDVTAHRLISEYKGEASVLDAKSRVWAYKSEDDDSYIIELWKTPQLISHLKKIGVEDKALKWHIKKLCEGSSFLVYKEGQVMCCKL